MNFGAKFRINRFGWFLIFFSVCLIIYTKSGSGSEQNPANDLVNIKSMLRAGIYAAQLGGQKVLNGKQNGLKTQSKGKTKEGANDPLTNADLSSNCAMYYSLKRTFPTVSIISEEHSNESECDPVEELDTKVSPLGHRNIDYLADEFVKPEDVTLWIDPLDATQEYTEDLNKYVTTMVCVAINGNPIVGIIHFPFESRTVWGWFTKKHSTNLADQEYVSNALNKNEPRVIVSRSHQGDVTQFVKNAFGDKALVTPAGGAGYKVYQVATGGADVYLHTTAIKKWDICAGNAIIKSLNGNMTTLKGNKINYSKDSKVVNSEGLLVTLFDHDYYLNKTLSVLQ